MARVDTLPHFLTDVADAIRTKKGTSETIQASDFDTEIENLPSGGEDISEYLSSTITGNTTGPSGSSYFPASAIKKMKNIKITSSVTNLSYAFQSLGNLTNISFSDEINMSNVTNMQGMFQACRSLPTIDLSKFNTSNVTIMANLFDRCVMLSGIIFGNNFDTSNVTVLASMFNSCRALTSLNLSNFNTSKVTNMNYMFNGCTSLSHLDIRNFTFDLVTSNYYDVFTGIPANCEIIVKSQTEKDWVLARRSDLTNVKTVAEYEAEQNA